jgi:hypothetical protein
MLEGRSEYHRPENLKIQLGNLYEEAILRHFLLARTEFWLLPSPSCMSHLLLTTCLFNLTTNLHRNVGIHIQDHTVSQSRPESVGARAVVFLNHSGCMVQFPEETLTVLIECFLGFPKLVLLNAYLFIYLLQIYNLLHSLQ